MWREKVRVRIWEGRGSSRGVGFEVEGFFVMGFLKREGGVRGGLWFGG